MIVTAEDEQVIGFFATKPTEGVLDQLFVSPNTKGRGIGTALLNGAMTDMPDGFWLRTADANHRHRHFAMGLGLTDLLRTRSTKSYRRRRVAFDMRNERGDPCGIDRSDRRLGSNASSDAWTPDPRIKAAVIAAPAFGFAFANAGLEKVRITIELWRAPDDKHQPNPWYEEPVRAALPNPA